MRSLTVKLTLAFLIVGLTGALLVALFIGRITRSAFSNFLLDVEQENLAGVLESYYAYAGSWEGLAESLRGPRRGSRRPWEDARDFTRSLSLFTLVDVDGQVVFSGKNSAGGGGADGGAGSAGSGGGAVNGGGSGTGSGSGSAGTGEAQVSADALRQASALVVDDQTVGWLIREEIPSSLLSENAEGVFLQRVNRAALVSAGLAAGLALVVGGALAFTLTRSLRQLREASEAIARGRLGLQVDIRSQDELGELAASFNKMSSDLARATHARRQMTADIAHDLRTPLSVIAGYTEALSDGKLPGTPEVYGVLHQETQYLNRLIEDLRLLSLADAGELALTLIPLDPGALLEQSAVRHTVAAEKQGVTLRVDAPGGLPLAQADPERLSQVLDNLIANALRYTPPGGEIRLSAASAPDGVQIQVADSGTGIPPADLEHIFDRFFRGDAARRPGGESGLGLAIARSIVEAHQGTITAANRPDRGAVFTIRLPSEKSSTSPRS